MSRIDILRAELTDDPLIRDYAAMSDVAAAADLNDDTRGITLPINTLTAAEIYEQINTDEFNVLSDANKTTVDRILSLGGDINLTVSSKARTALLAVFAGAAGAITRSSIGAAVIRAVSRAEELGITNVREGHVQEARRV